MIRNVCIHILNEQPLLCDLFELPTSDDAGLVCMNVRSMDGKRPVFIDHIGSTFFFPYHVVRFLEIPEESMAAYRAAGGRAPAVALAQSNGAGPHDGEDDRAPGSQASTTHGEESLLPVAVSVPQDADDGDLDVDLEIDEDFLRRVRDI